MLRWTLIFLVLAIVAGLVGVLGAESPAMEVANVVAIAFIVLFIISTLVSRKAPPAV